MDSYNRITHDIIGSALRIHTKLGPGLFESVYHTVLVRDIRNQGYDVESEKPVPLIFEDLFFEKTFYADIVVDGKVLVEVKCESSITPLHIKQTLTYVRLLDLRLGLVLNFGTPSLGIKRIAN